VAREGSQRGFTLLEILVVVLIIGVVTAGMLLSMSFAGKDTDLETESKRLLSLMDYAREQAELQTRDYGILFSQHGYEFVVYDVRRGLWRQVMEDDALRERALPSGLDFKLIVDARSIVLRDNLDAVNAQLASAANSKSDSQSQLRPAARAPSDSNSDSSSGDNTDSGSGSDSDSSSDSGAGSVAPQVMIFAGGDLSSFKITVERAAAGRSITLDENRDGDIVEKPMVESGT
jgi:general secretion pathway protein H